MKFYDSNPNEGAIEITTKVGCNLYCKCCPQSVFVTQYYNMFPNGENILTLNAFASYIETIPTNVRIEFSGMSEPFLNPECADMILYASKKGHPIGIYTTLVGVNRDILEKILDIEYDVFCIHLPDNEGNTQVLMNDEYLYVLKKCIDNVKGYKYFTFQGNDVHNNIKRMVYGKLQFSNVIYERAGVIANEKFNMKGKIKCSSMCKDNVLLPNGAVLLCCQDYSLKYILGNLGTDSYASIMNSVVMKDIKDKLDDINSKIMCRNCYFAQSENYDMAEPDIQVLLEKSISMQWKLLDARNLISELRKENSLLKGKKLKQSK